MKIFAVAGGSGMGKTLFTKMLGERLPKSVVLPMDQYYFDKPDDIPAEKYDFDSPQALDFRLFHKALNELDAGNPVRMPQFDYVHAKRTKEYVKIVPGDICSSRDFMCSCMPASVRCSVIPSSSKVRPM